MRRKAIYTRTVVVISVLSLLGVFLLIAREIENFFLPYDLYVFETLQHVPYITPLMQLITHLADWYIIVAGTMLMIYLLRKDRFAARLFPILIVSATLLTQFLKLFFARARPTAIELGYSFPSGHATLGMMFYGLAAYFAYRKRRMPLVPAILVVLGLLIGISRIWISVHWLSDVLAGFALALAMLIIAIVLLEGRRKRRKRTTHD